MTVDYSKIDFTKCKLPKIAENCIEMFAEATSDEVRVCIKDVCDSHHDALAIKKKYSDTWYTGPDMGERVIDALPNIQRATSIVDAFIAAETARVEAEEEQANWVAVPWQDVEFLEQSGATVHVKYQSGKHGKRHASDIGKPGLHLIGYCADRRTFPDGYDPEKPRWVEFPARMFDELKYKHGCDCSRVNHPERGTVVVVDAHTLPPGVPLHEEPKPGPRPCSREFALSHLDESQARVRSGSQWGNWVSAGVFDYVHDISSYEFRTTAKEETALDLGPFPDVTIDVNEEVSQALAIHLLKSRRVAIVDLETGQRFMVTPGPLGTDPDNVCAAKTKTMTCLEFAKSLVESNQEKYILVNGKCYGYRFNREHCRIETGIATGHGTVDWGPSFGFGAASDVITVTE